MNNQNNTKVEMYCPFCDDTHILNKFERKTQGLIKGEIITYIETVFSCPLRDEDENEFVPAKIMDDNLLNARDAYRATKGLLTSLDIAAIRKTYGLTQSEFSNLFGWGDVTVTRYESKSIQDETYDNVMRMSLENPLFTLKCLEKHKEKFNESKYKSIRNRIAERVDAIGLQYLKTQEINSVYINYNGENELNGFKILDIDKLKNVIGYFANSVTNLYKVKLMKLLWYADMLHYIRHDKAMMGLVYKHMPYGALPLAYDEVIYLPTVKIFEEVNHDDISYRILPNSDIDLSNFTNDELKILDLIISKFNNFKTKELVDYMHEEKAYLLTKPNQLISYELAKPLKELE